MKTGGDKLPDKFKVDYLSLYRGKPLRIPDSNIEIHIPTLEQICDYGEIEYYSMVNCLCSVGINLCWQLEEMGIDFEAISDYQLFYDILCTSYDVEQTRILFGDKLDFTKMRLYENRDNKSISMVQKYLISIPLISSLVVPREIIQIPVGSVVQLLEKTEQYCKISYEQNIGYVMSIYISTLEDGTSYISDIYNPQCYGNGVYENIIINENIYFQIVGYLRAIHNLKRDDRVAGTRSCRMAFIEDAKMEYEAALLEPRKSVLLPMISTMVNSEGFKRNDKTVWDMNIFAFMDSVKRSSKIKNATLLLQSGYSGFGVDLKKINKDEIDYMGELN